MWGLWSPNIDVACVCARVCLVVRQTLLFGERVLRMTIAARPAFVSIRQSNMPVFVLAFNVSTVVFIAVLIGKQVPHFLQHAAPTTMYTHSRKKPLPLTYVS